tara:strand:- start:425 stop:943 length:519 start_codon:yes stop_codon:yes gene_type:complete
MNIEFRMSEEESFSRGRLEERGIYHVTLDDMKPKESKAGNQMVAWTVRVQHGDNKGQAAYGQIMLRKADGSTYPYTAQQWGRLLRGVGYTPVEAEQLLKEGFSDSDDNDLPTFAEWTRDNLLGREGWIEFTPSIGEDSFPRIEWVAAKEAQSRKAIAAEAAAAREDMDDMPF